MPISGKNSVKEINIDNNLKNLIDKAQKVYFENFNGDAWLGRCIFLSWYCALGDCDFCFRSTQKHKIQHPATARRTYESIYTEAFLCKVNNWKLEFLTGGYGIFEFDDIVKICKTISEIFGEKIWVNLGTLSKPQFEKLLPYINGYVASVETLEPILHKKVAPSKPMAPYEKSLNVAKELGLKTSITIVLGLGEPIDDYKYVKEFIKKHELSRITYYALRPVKGTPYENGPDPEFVAKWITKTRIDFPKIEIIVGTAETRLPEISLLLRSGANAITKIPATKIYGTTGAEDIHNLIKSADRNFISELRKLPDVNWSKEVNKVIKDKILAEKIISKIKDYEKNRLNKSYKEFSKIKKLEKDKCEPCGE
ncbi:radical SAM protein [Candidatus Woesearchaeota archaeon]|nr:radical SAM protein [Candidatus Woesearchaeota archaeon]MCF7901125.1 radical SAM protein [Candidatus Woesearchaeota archaeon]MCF8012886.1 radical SAM protein [Candidatus Woesearchaeota archaeon]